MIDCDKLPGHLKQVCLGEYRQSNGKPYTDSERAEIIGRFLRTSVEPGELPRSLVKPHAPKPIKSDIGTRLHAVIERDAGKIECGECRDEVTRLNLMSASAVIDQADAIAEGIVDRGKRKAPKFWQRWGATLAPGLAKEKALSWVHEATGYPWKSETRHLIFHLYPLRGKEWNWHWHIEQIRQHQDKFNGRIVIGVGIDAKTATMEEVQRAFSGVQVTDWLKVDNNRMAETLTHVEMLSLLKTDDPNEVIFRAHTKGVTHQRDSVEQQWAEIMWTGNMDLASVSNALESHLTCGVMRSQKPLVKRKPGNFFYAGSFYWMRAKEVFARDWRHTETNRWWVEYVPCHLFSFEESACLFHDMTASSVLRQSYFDEHVNPEWATWKAARGIDDASLRQRV